MMSSCDALAERVAVGDPPGELAAHVAGCARCQQLVTMAGQLGAARHDVDPGLGFSARMTIGAKQRLVARRRRRVAVVLAATTCAGVLGALVFIRAPVAPTVSVPTATEIRPETPPAPVARVASDEELAALVRLADLKRNTRITARWSHITRPLAPYRALVEGVTR